MKNIELKQTIPVKGEYDIIVAGGGVAGVAAAVSGARMGKRVLLIEKTICLGGLATIGLVNYFVPMCNGRGVQIIKGMADEFLRLSIRYGYDTMPENWKNGDPKSSDARLVTRYSAPIFILALTELIQKEKVSILFDSVVSDVVMEGGICKGVVVTNKSGYEYYAAKMFIDTTGDGDLMYRADVPTVQGKNFHTFYTIGANLDTAERALTNKDFGQLQTFYFGGTANLYGGGHPEGKPYWLGTNAQDITNYVVENHMETLEKLKQDHRSSRDVTQIPTMCQFRTTRHIDGNYTLQESDTYRHFNDSVGAICDFDRRDFLFEIPYSTMVREGYENIITAGRTAAGEGYAWDVLRVIPPAILSGQAAGVACAQAIDGNRAICDADISLLQKTLTAQNVDIHFDDDLVPQEGTGGEKADSEHI